MQTYISLVSHQLILIEHIKVIEKLIPFLQQNLMICKNLRVSATELEIMQI